MDKLVSVRDFQTAADDCLHPIQIGYYNCGSDNEVTLQDNCNAFQRYYFNRVVQIKNKPITIYVLRIKLNPRVCVDVSEGSTVCGVLGFDLNMPIGIAPTALHRMANLDGEIATAKGNREIGVAVQLQRVLERLFGSALYFPIFYFQPLEKQGLYTSSRHILHSL